MAEKFTYPQDVVWTQKSGALIRLGDMEDSHLANCIRLIRRKRDKYDAELSAAYTYPGDPDSMGSYYADIAGDEAAGKAAECSREIEIFMDELRRRHPDAKISICRDGERLRRLRL